MSILSGRALLKKNVLFKSSFLEDEVLNNTHNRKRDYFAVIIGEESTKVRGRSSVARILRKAVPD